MRKARTKFVGGRSRAIDRFNHQLGNFEELRERGKYIRECSIHHWDALLEQFSWQAEKNGASVHWAVTAEEANQVIVGIARRNKVRSVVKSKSMLSEETELNRALEQAGVEVTETDLGEYILQLDGDKPSHIIAPAVHKSRREVASLFSRCHQGEEQTDDIKELTKQARRALREKFLRADMGITGANFIVAETASAGIITNEGNGVLTSSVPAIRVVVCGIEKILPRLQDCAHIVELLPRSATGQATTSYLTLTTRPLHETGEGPQQLHFVLVDAGRSELRGSAYEEMLHCIRCGACMNHCPVYHHVGGHAYGWVYPGPMGSVLTPLYRGIQEARELPHAATLCKQCDVVCPVKIPLTTLLRQLREDQVKKRISPLIERLAIRLWGWLALHPRLYRCAVALVRSALRLVSGKRGIRLPLLQVGWFYQRHLPSPKR